MDTSQKGLDLIKEFEGFRTDAYLCPANVLTIGYGHTSAAGPPTVKKGMKVTRAKAEQILRDDLQTFENGVERAVKRKLTQGQFDALVSFAYNCGIGALQKSTLLKRVNAGDFDRVPAEFMKWTRAGGRELPGLVRRRRAEARLWRELDERPAQPEEARTAPEPPKPTKTMVQSREGNTAAITGASAGLAAANEAARTLRETSDNVSSVTDLFTDPTFVVLALVVVACIAIWFWRRQRLIEDES